MRKGKLESRQNKGQPGGVSWRDSVTVWALCQPGSGHRPGQAEDLRQDFRAGGGFKQSPVWRRHTYPATLLRLSSERVRLAVEVGDRGRQGRSTGRQAQALQNLSCRIGRMNCCKNFHAPAATFGVRTIMRHLIQSIGSGSSDQTIKPL